MTAADLHDAIDGAAEARVDWQAELARLAALPAIAYDQQREAAAERLGCRVGTLDREVARIRGETGEDTAVSGEALNLADPELWPESVDGAALLQEIDAALGRHVIMAVEGRHAVALWAVFSFSLDSFSFAPRLLVKSPQRRCGKTTLLDTLLELCRRPVPASNISAPALFRTIARGSPTVVLDEADTFMRQNEELRGLVNSGHRRSLAFVIRNVERNGDFEPRKFSTWCAWRSPASAGSTPRSRIGR
jgi:putative DNA primase/helicase